MDLPRTFQRAFGDNAVIRITGVRKMLPHEGGGTLHSV
jgi:hypothetical protein